MPINTISLLNELEAQSAPVQLLAPVESIIEAIIFLGSICASSLGGGAIEISSCLMNSSSSSSIIIVITILSDIRDGSHRLGADTAAHHATGTREDHGSESRKKNAH
jgi:hypothetical protein